jgi:hypothetical protein
MLKKNITPKNVCDLLNEMLELDYSCTEKLIEHRVPCNGKIADHASIQVQQFKTDNSPKVGLIGVLNGMFGVRKDGMGAICYEIDFGKIVRFKPTPEKKK